jgi:hypothetical protein
LRKVYWFDGGTVKACAGVRHVQFLRRGPALGDKFGMDDERAMRDATKGAAEQRRF